MTFDDSRVGGAAQTPSAPSSRPRARQAPQVETQSALLACSGCREPTRHHFLRADFDERAFAWLLLYTCIRCSSIRRWGRESPAGAIQSPGRAY